MRTDVADARLDLDREAQLYATRAEADPSARAEFVEACLPLARRLAQRYVGRGEPFDDLEQAARLGLVNAVDRYDPGRGSFTAFAVITMLGELRKHFRDRTWGVRAPRRLQDLLLQIRHTDADLSNAGDRAELADRLDTSVDEVDRAVLSAAGYTPRSLNAPITGGDSGDAAEYGDLIGEIDADLAAVDDRLTLLTLLERLPERERQILVLRFYGDLTQVQIAERCGISQMHVSRLLSRTLTWLRHAMLSDTTPPWGAESPMDQPRLALTTTRARGGVVTVAVGGEVDRDSADQLRRAVLDAVASHAAEVRVDLSGVPFVDAAGVAALVACYQEATRAAVELRVRGAQPYVRRVLSLSRFHRL
ncbi:sigma-70 family RNA polymerase sigma factor [Phytohabitans sp. LJ34]|uniref:sigma-70 family RNA polymerase sigma factor n=1 Tax=Phytohabitans sp. LJ34 TaxID=3452217 RepID=UPI003F8A0748